MKKFFAQLRPLERRLAVGVLVVVIFVLNLVFIWPHHSDWSNLKNRLVTARTKLKTYQDTVAQTPVFQKQVSGLESSGEAVPAEDQAGNFVRSIQMESVASGVQIVNMTRQPTSSSDPFFVEQAQNVNVLADDKQLVDFLYKLGSGGSLIRVRNLELQPDTARQHLNAGIQLVASYQKNAQTDLKPATASKK
jgi:Tfp pilus assembly protein PilO